MDSLAIGLTIIGCNIGLTAINVAIAIYFASHLPKLKAIKRLKNNPSIEILSRKEYDQVVKERKTKPNTLYFVDW